MKKIFKIMLALLLCLTTVVSSTQVVRAAPKYKVLVLSSKTETAKGVAKWLSDNGFEVTHSTLSKYINPSKFDALVIPGGSDVSAKYSGSTVKPARSSEALDKRQIDAIKKFADAGKPVFGICRGLQIINCAYGGTLKKVSEQSEKTIKITKGSQLYKAYGSSEKVKDVNNWVVNKLGSGLKVVARDSNSKRNYVEAIEHTSKPVYAVQFHPEKMSASQQKLILNTWKTIIKNSK